MSQTAETFFSAVGCMDGRVQSPIALFGKKKFGTDFPDTITEAGLVALVAKNSLDMDLLKFKLINVSVNKHHTTGIIVHGHQECAGNPVSDEQHKKDILLATSKIAALLPAESTLPIIPVFVIREGKKWIVEEL